MIILLTLLYPTTTYSQQEDQKQKLKQQTKIKKTQRNRLTDFDLGIERNLSTTPRLI